MVQHTSLAKSFQVLLRAGNILIQNAHSYVLFLASDEAGHISLTRQSGSPDRDDGNSAALHPEFQVATKEADKRRRSAQWEKLRQTQYL